MPRDHTKRLLEPLLHGVIHRSPVVTVEPGTADDVLVLALVHLNFRNLGKPATQTQVRLQKLHNLRLSLLHSISNLGYV